MMVLGWPSDKDEAAWYRERAAVNAAQGKYEDAMELLRLSLDVELQVHRTDHPSLEVTYSAMIATLKLQGRHAKAVRLLRISELITQFEAMKKCS